MEFIFLFSGINGKFPSGVFSSKEKATQWIETHKLSGMLTQYPIDIGVYEWAIQNDFFTPKYENQKTPKFIQQFSSAYMKHWHFDNGNEE